MRILRPPALSEASDCPYLENRVYRQEYFVGTGLDEHQFQQLLNDRWRRFGAVFFRPVCPDCRECVPIRIPVAEFRPGKSQRRVERKNSDTRVLFSELNYRDELYAIYERHSRLRFDQGSGRDEFVRNFYTPAVHSFQSEYYIGDTLIGFGFLDRSSDGLSSVYFCFDPDYSSYSPGTFSVLAEMKQCAVMGLGYYYLGYYVAECSRMAYKGRFLPYELLRDGAWGSPEDSLEDPVGVAEEEKVE
jgi:arginine-tRNA-protein transferase